MPPPPAPGCSAKYADSLNDKAPLPTFPGPFYDGYNYHDWVKPLRKILAKEGLITLAFYNENERRVSRMGFHVASQQFYSRASHPISSSSKISLADRLAMDAENAKKSVLPTGGKKDSEFVNRRNDGGLYHKEEEEVSEEMILFGDQHDRIMRMIIIIMDSMEKDVGLRYAAEMGKNINMWLDRPQLVMDWIYDDWMRRKPVQSMGSVADGFTEDSGSDMGIFGVNKGGKGKGGEIGEERVVTAELAADGDTNETVGGDGIVDDIKGQSEASSNVIMGDSGDINRELNGNQIVGEEDVDVDMTPGGDAADDSEGNTHPLQPTTLDYHRRFPDTVTVKNVGPNPELEPRPEQPDDEVRRDIEMTEEHHSIAEEEKNPTEAKKLVAEEYSTNKELEELGVISIDSHSKLEDKEIDTINEESEMEIGEEASVCEEEVEGKEKTEVKGETCSGIDTDDGDVMGEDKESVVGDIDDEDDSTLVGDVREEKGESDVDISGDMNVEVSGDKVDGVGGADVDMSTVNSEKKKVSEDDVEVEGVRGKQMWMLTFGKHRKFKVGKPIWLKKVAIKFKFLTRTWKFSSARLKLVSARRW